MPNRTEEVAKFIDSLPIKEPDEFCNARGPGGYCGKTAGWGTGHPGTGRCRLHGGNAGRPVVHGMYSEKLQKSLRQTYDAMMKQPEFIDLYGELSILKAMMGKLLGNVKDKYDNEHNWMVQAGKNGNELSAELNGMLKILEQLRKTYEGIIKAETRLENNLTPQQIFIIVNNIKVVMDKKCGSCPIRSVIAEEIDSSKEKPLYEIISENKNNKRS